MAHAQAGPQPAEVRKRDPGGTKARIVRAALELFTSQGYHGTTTPLLAKRAGIAEGTIYRHFASKEVLLNELYRAGVRMLAKSLADADAGGSCRERLIAVATDWQDLAIREPQLVRLVFFTDTTDLLDHRSRSDFRAVRMSLEGVIAAGKSSGEVKAGSAEVWTDAWLSLVKLVLERTANREWRGQHQGPRLILASAWDAIRLTTGATAGAQPATRAGA